MGGDVSVDARHRENQVKYAVSGRGNAWEKDVYIYFPAIYFLSMATNISYHLPFIRKPVLDNKPAQPQIVLLLALMLLLCPSQHISNWSKLLRAADRYAYRLWKHCLFCRESMEGKDIYILLAFAPFCWRRPDRLTPEHGHFSNIRHLSAIKEVEELSEIEQIGSSVVPFKKNPMRSERLRPNA